MENINLPDDLLKIVNDYVTDITVVDYDGNEQYFINMVEVKKSKILVKELHTHRPILITNYYFKHAVKITGDITLYGDCSHMFYKSNFNGDISKWNVSRVHNMSCMFVRSKFNGDISNWDVSQVHNMSHMFGWSKFNGDISNWVVSRVCDMSCMFYESIFNGDISKWDVFTIK